MHKQMLILGAVASLALSTRAVAQETKPPEGLEGVTRPHAPAKHPGGSAAPS